MSLSNRDTLFAGFAKLLVREMGCEEFERIISQRAYDLAVHVIHLYPCIEERGVVMTPGEMLLRMSDCTSIFEDKEL